jgi:hypothetical protein
MILRRGPVRFFEHQQGKTMSHGEMLALGLLALCCVLGATGIVAAIFEDDPADALWFYLVASGAACCAAVTIFCKRKK